MSRRRPLVALLACLAAARGMAAPVVAVTSENEEARVFLGTTDATGAATFGAMALRVPAGNWSTASPLQPPAPGRPLAHRGLSWFLETRVDRAGTQHHVLMPRTGEMQAIGLRIECVQGTQDAVLATQDAWTFTLTELVPPGHIFARLMVSHGAAMEVEIVREAAWTVQWPDGSRLLAGAVLGDGFVAVGLTPSSVLVVSAPDGATPRDLPELPLTRGQPVAAVVTSAGPVAIVAEAGALVARRWQGDAWTEPAELALPASGVVTAIAATAIGGGRDRVMVVALTDQSSDPPRAATLIGSAWSAVETLPLPRLEPGIGAPRPREPKDIAADVEHRQRKLRFVRWGLVLLALPILALLLARVARRGR